MLWKRCATIVEKQWIMRCRIRIGEGGVCGYVLVVNGGVREMKPNLKVHFSSLRLDWRTPERLFRQLDREFHFGLDPCGDKRYPLKKDMIIFEGNEGRHYGWWEWDTSVFMNPPYGREIGKWLKKAYEESLMGVTVVALIPSRTDTKWWHDYVMKVPAEDIRFIKGRLHFDDHKNSAPFPSAVVVFRGRT